MSTSPDISPAILDDFHPGVFHHASRIAAFSRPSEDALPTESFAYEVGKRVLDLALAVLLLPLAGVLIAAIAAAIAITSGGPIIYRHQRIGRRGRPFTIWKFRTMHLDGSRILHQHLERNAGAQQEWAQNRKLQSDPRVTPLGKMLRKSSLDELPQILNVFAGEMSFVGPRPIVREETPKYANRLHYYLAARPGVTGLWQVSGRCNLSYETRVILDETYVRSWTLGADLWILLQTPQAVLRRDGAC